MRNCCSSLYKGVAGLRVWGAPGIHPLWMLKDTAFKTETWSSSLSALSSPPLFMPPWPSPGSRSWPVTSEWQWVSARYRKWGILEKTGLLGVNLGHTKLNELTFCRDHLIHWFCCYGQEPISQVIGCRVQERQRLNAQLAVESRPRGPPWLRTTIFTFLKINSLFQRSTDHHGSESGGLLCLVIRRPQGAVCCWPSLQIYSSISENKFWHFAFCLR